MFASAGRSCTALELSISASSSDETRKQEKRYHVMAGEEGGKVKQGKATCRIHICFDRAAPSRAVRVAWTANLTSMERTQMLALLLLASYVGDKKGKGRIYSAEATVSKVWTFRVLQRGTECVVCSVYGLVWFWFILQSTTRGTRRSSAQCRSRGFQ